ncbi:MAG: hypothetical protein EOP04_23830, partial [Proteobacteria bacterium]
MFSNLLISIDESGRQSFQCLTTNNARIEFNRLGLKKWIDPGKVESQVKNILWVSMQSVQLVLGLGNESKNVLQTLENEFLSWQFAILDCWSKVQEVKVVEEKHFEGDDLRLRFIHNLNHFVTRPKVEVRADMIKYEDAETQKIIPYLPHYIDLLQKEKQIRFPKVVKKLTRYKEVLIVCPTVDGFSLVWLHALVKALQLQSTIRIFSWYPFLLEGQLKTEMAIAVCE